MESSPNRGRIHLWRNWLHAVWLHMLQARVFLGLCPTLPFSLPYSPFFCVCLDFLMHLQYRALVYQLKDHKNCLQFVINNQSIDVFDMKHTSTNEKLEQSFHFESHRLSSSVLLQIIFFLSAYICFFFLSFIWIIFISVNRQTVLHAEAEVNDGYFIVQLCLQPACSVNWWVFATWLRSLSTFDKPHSWFWDLS